MEIKNSPLVWGKKGDMGVVIIGYFLLTLDLIFFP